MNLSIRDGNIILICFLLSNEDGRNKESKATSPANGKSDSEIWNPLFSTIPEKYRKILASPNLELEAKQANGEYKSIKNDNPRPNQYPKLNTNLLHDPKEAYSRLKFPNVS